MTLTKNSIKPPKSQGELLERANNLTGLTLAQIREQFDADLPQDLKRDKGWAGQILEVVLGATAGSRPEPDFAHLDIELKTIPIDEYCRPRESTFVTMVQFNQMSYLTWDCSYVWKKA